MKMLEIVEAEIEFTPGAARVRVARSRDDVAVGSKLCYIPLGRPAGL